MLSVTYNPYMVSVIVPYDIMLSVIMLNVIMLSVFMLSVLAPSTYPAKGQMSATPQESSAD